MLKTFPQTFKDMKRQYDQRDMKNTLSPASHELQVKGREDLILNINWENWAI